MLNIVYIEKEMRFSQELCDEYCNKMVNVIRQRDRRPYATNTSRIANMNHSGYTAQLIVGRLLGEDELTLAEETMFVVRGNVLDGEAFIAPINTIVTDAGFNVEHARYAAYDGVNNCTSFLFTSAGRLNDIIARSDSWKGMPKAHESWENYKC